MTDLVPQQDTAPSGAMVSRQAVTPTAPVPAMTVSDIERQANMIAKLDDKMLPKGYVNKPGACLLAIDWANRNDVAILDAIAEVAFVYGRPVVSARMQKRLASRAGYRTKKIDGDEQSCTVAVIGPDGEEIGRSTYTIELAQAHKLTTRSDVWKADPGQMLFHRATTRALDHYGPAELAGVFVDAYEEPDPVEVVTPAHSPVERPEAIEAASTPALPEPAPGGDVEAEIRALAKQHRVKVTDILKYAQTQWPDAEPALSTIEAIAADQAKTEAVKGWIQGE